MKIYNPIGSKERLVEIFENVNAVQIKESDTNPANATLFMKFEQLMNKELNVRNTNVQSNNDESFIELNCTDEENNAVNFKFKATATQDDQEDVFLVDSAVLIEFSIKYHDGGGYSLGENDLQQINQNFQNELFSIVGEFGDFEDEVPEIDEAKYMDAVKKIDSYPFGGTPRDDMQTAKNYVDNKPTNDKLRVKAPELDSFVDESLADEIETTTVDNISKNYYNSASSDTKRKTIQHARKYYDDYLGRKGLSIDDIGGFERYKAQVKKLAQVMYEQKMAGLNETDVENTEDNIDVDMTTDTQIDNAGEENIDVDSEFDIEKLSQDKEEAGEVIPGGLGDGKSPLDFNKDQILLGLDVEMEHTDDPMIALEITMDHLSEDPEYYTTKETPEDSAQANASMDAEETAADDSADSLLGFEPKNVGDEIEVEKNDDDTEKTDVLLGFEPKNVGDEAHPLADILDDDGTAVDLSKENDGPKGINRALEDEPVNEDNKKEEKQVITEDQIKMARQALNNRGVVDGMTKKEAVQILIKHNIK